MNTHHFKHDGDALQRLQQELPSAILRQVGQCGHIPHVEKPREAAKLVLEFLGSDNTEKADETSSLSSTLRYAIVHWIFFPFFDSNHWKLWYLLSCSFGRMNSTSTFDAYILSNVLQYPVKKTRPLGWRVSRGNMYIGALLLPLVCDLLEFDEALQQASSWEQLR